MSPMSQKLLRPRQTGFDPRSLTNLELWLDFTDSATLTLSGSSISQVNDKSGNGRNATQGIGANQPTFTTNAINGRSAATFDGNNDRLLTGSFSSPTAASAFLVLQANAWTASGGYRGVFSHGYTGSSTAGASHCVLAPANFQDWDTNDIISIGNGFNSTQFPRAVGPSAAGSNFRIISSVLGSTLSRIYVNGARLSTRVEKTGTIVSANAEIVIGANTPTAEFWNGAVAEILYYGRQLSASEIQRVHQYLASKYAITVTT